MDLQRRGRAGGDGFPLFLTQPQAMARSRRIHAVVKVLLLAGASTRITSAGPCCWPYLGAERRHLAGTRSPACSSSMHWGGLAYLKSILFIDTSHCYRLQSCRDGLHGKVAKYQVNDANMVAFGVTKSTLALEHTDCCLPVRFSRGSIRER